MYFIHYLKLYSSTNNKGRELNEFMSKFEDTLVYNELALDALKQEVQNKVDELNRKYPKVQEFFFSDGIEQWAVKPGNRTDNHIFILNFSKVRSTYKFMQQAGIPQQMTYKQLE